MTTFFLYLQAQVHLKREGKRTWTTTSGTTMCGKETWPPFKQQRWSWESWVTSTQKTIWPDILNSVCKIQNCVSLQHFIEWWGAEDSEWVFWEMVHDWPAIARLQGFTSASFFFEMPRYADKPESRTVQCYSPDANLACFFCTDGQVYDWVQPGCWALKVRLIK